MAAESEPDDRPRRRLSPMTLLLALAFWVPVGGLLLAVAIAGTDGLAVLAIPLDAFPAALAILAVSRPKVYSRPLADGILGCLGLQWFGMLVLNASSLARAERSEWMVLWMVVLGVTAWLLALIMYLRRGHPPRTGPEEPSTAWDDLVA